MRRALVILGDAEIGNAIKNGVEANNQPKPYVENPRIGVRAATGFRNWKSAFYDIYDKYGFVDDYAPPGIVSQKLLLAWALMWAGIFECYKRLSAWNRQA